MVRKALLVLRALLVLLLCTGASCVGRSRPNGLSGACLLALKGGGSASDGAKQAIPAQRSCLSNEGPLSCRPLGCSWKSIVKAFSQTEDALARLSAPSIRDPDVRKVVVKTVAVSVWTVLALCAIGTFGVDTKPILSLLSVATIAVGLAAREVLAGIISGLFVVTAKPFERGSVISVNGLRGRVLSVDACHVHLQSLTDGARIVLPTALLAQQAIVIEASS